MPGVETSTNDISHYIGMLDPWYERNVLGLMNLPMDVLCQSAKLEAEPQEDSREQLPILADMILYYCRFATRPVLLQLYQTEVGEGGSALSWLGGKGDLLLCNQLRITCKVDVGTTQLPRANEAKLSLSFYSFVEPAACPLHVSSWLFG